MSAQSTLKKIDRFKILARKKIGLANRRTGKASTIFISGMQRSGTNMVMDILERSLDTDTYHERDPRAFDDYQMRDQDTIRRLMDKSKARFFVIKSLCESQHLRQLLQEFEPAKALWVVRNYDDAVNSMMISFPGFADRIKLIARDRNSCGWRGQNMSDTTHELIRRHTHSPINEATAAALKWYYRNILFFEQGFERDDRVKPISYETLVTHPVDEMRDIFNFLGLGFHANVVRWVSPRSVRRRPPPEIEPEVRKICDDLSGKFDELINPNQI